MSTRDTQFAQFAKLLTDEILDLSIWTGTRSAISQRIAEIVAKRAYDLVEHAFMTMEPIAPQCCQDLADIARDTPDLTELPE